MKKILVAGGAGFLGSHLVKRLLKEGNEVFCLDNFLTSNRANVAAFLLNPQFHLIEHDVCEPIDLDVDEIYNLACPASPVHYQADPIYTVKISVLGALHLLELAKKRGAKIFQASTSEVYGDPHVHPQQESYWGHVNPIGIRACYDEGKRCAETLFFDYHRRYQIPIKVARIFNTYGPKMDPKDGRVVSNFIMQALQHLPITIHGEGKQTRSFCYVDDLIEVIYRLMQSPDRLIGPFNIGNPEECTVLDLAHEVLKLTDSRSPIVFHPLPLDDPQQRRPDITLVQEALGWRPQIALAAGLPATIDYFTRLTSCVR